MKRDNFLRKITLSTKRRWWIRRRERDSVKEVTGQVQYQRVLRPIISMGKLVYLSLLVPHGLYVWKRNLTFQQTLDYCYCTNSKGIKKPHISKPVWNDQIFFLTYAHSKNYFSASLQTIRYNTNLFYIRQVVPAL